MEKLFSKDELIEIESEATQNMEMYLDTTVLNGQSNEKTIITISKDKQLIFVEGNKDTGFQHLRDRHGFFSFKNYWQSDGANVKLDNPTKFHPAMMPIIDFVKIADAVFNIENKNITKNTRPDVFDKYTGTFSYKEEPEQEAHLIVYKDTKIVHSLFPNKKKYNRKIKLKYGKGNVTTSLKFPEGYNDLTVPYEDSRGVIVYSILIRKFYAEQIEKVFIQKHDEQGEPKELFFLGQRAFSDFESFDRENMAQYQYGDLSDFEDIINQIDKGTSD